MTPTQRTLALVKSWGWHPWIVERWIPGTFVRRDLFHIIDIIALTGTEIVGVQSCGEAFAEHREKLVGEQSANTSNWIASGGRLFLIGWRPLKIKRGGVAVRYEPWIHEFFVFDLWEPKMRTPKNIVAELVSRGRNLIQIRAIAIARDDDDLLEYVNRLISQLTEDLT